MVERITGVPKDQFLKAADLFTSIRKDGDMKKAGTVIYAVGWTQHSSGTQTIRTAAMLQLLLGNVGRAGGGVNALRGHSNIQGATDMAGIFDILPGYLKMVTATDVDLEGVPGAHHAEVGETRAVGFLQLLVQYAQVRGVVSQGDVRRSPPPRKTTGHSITCPRSTAAIPGRRSGTTCTAATSRACWRSA